MPDTAGKLTLAEQERIRQWMGEKGAVRSCPICGNNQWAIGETLALAPLYMSHGIVLGAGYPAVVIVCTRCAFFRWHSAIAIGLLPEESKEERKPEQEAKHGA